MSDFDRDELICDIWDRHSDSDGLMDIMGARKFAIDLLSSVPNHPSPAEPPDREAIRNEVLKNIKITMDATYEKATVEINEDSPYDNGFNAGLLEMSCAVDDAINAMKSQPILPSDSQAEVSDSEMLDWVLRMIEGDDSTSAEMRLKLGKPLCDGLSGRRAIKAAMRAEREGL